jgi:hypothetical protein
MFLVFRKDKESDKCKKTTANLPKSFRNEAFVSSSSEYDIYKKEDTVRFEIEQTHFVSSLNKNGVLRRVTTFH